MFLQVATLHFLQNFYGQNAYYFNWTWKWSILSTLKGNNSYKNMQKSLESNQEWADLIETLVLNINILFWPLNCLYKKVKLHFCAIKKVAVRVNLSDWCLTPNDKFPVICISCMARTSCIRWDAVHFLLEPCLLIVLAHWSNSLQVDITLHSWHNILILSQPVFALTL